jgi:ADP-ribosylglycohydrolase
MIGAIAGDIIGSAYEFHNVKSTEFELFSSRSRPTDDTILSVAVADCILHGKDYAQTIKQYGRKYSRAGYGPMFRKWLASDSLAPYSSFGNGSAMRVSPVGFAFSSLEEVLVEAARSATVTHNHPEGIKGAQAVAASIFLARTVKSKEIIRSYVRQRFGYDMDQTIDDIRPHYRFNATCQGSVPQAIIAFLESDGYEDAVRKAISLGGDSDTLACMTGGIAQAYYGHIPEQIVTQSKKRLDAHCRQIVELFEEKYGLGLNLLNDTESSE